VLVEGGADPKLATQAGITPLMVASGLDYWQGESPGPFTGVPEADRLEAVQLALELGNDINAHADFGDYPMVGDTDYTLLYYPTNIDDLVDKGVGDPRWSGSTALVGAVVSGQASIVQFLVDHGAQVDAKTKLGWTADGRRRRSSQMPRRNFRSGHSRKPSDSVRSTKTRPSSIEERPN
jgi:hypothetical protein